MSRRIFVRHPGYEDPNVLFMLPAREGPDRDHAHYATISAACSILANNPGEFWLSRSAQGETREVGSPEGLIRGGDYYLHVPGEAPYPVVPNFRSWRFPHGAVPPMWREASESAARGVDLSPELLGSERCRFTNKRLVVEKAHLIPVSEKPWFTSNGMDRYASITGRSGDIVADTPDNRIRLQAHAHKLWDGLQFSIVPRETNGETTYFSQMMNEDDELEEDWHNKRLQSLAGRPPEYLFARFAWHIFPKLIGFLQAGYPLRLAVRQADGTRTARMHSVAECLRYTISQGRGRSGGSPTKRARSETGVDDEEDWAYSDENGWVQDHAGGLSQSAVSVDSAVAGIADHAARSKRARPGICEDASHEWSLWDEEEEDRGRKRTRC